MTSEELLESYRDGRRDFSGEDLVRADLNGADLTDANFTHADLSGARLNGARIKGAKFTKAKLIRAELRGAIASTLLPSDLDHSPPSASFDGADLSEADLSEAQLAFCTFSGAVLDRANATGAVLRLCNFNQASLMACRLDRARLGDCNLGSALLYRSFNLDQKTDRATFVGADLSDTTFPSDLAGMNFSGATISQWKVSEAMLDSSDLSYARLESCSFVNASLKNCNLRGCHFTWCDLHFADLVGSKGGILDFTRTAGTRFSTGAFKAPSWIALRDSYTGVKTLFHLLLLLAFLLPLIGRVAFWVSVNKAQALGQSVAASAKTTGAALDSTARTIGVDKDLTSAIDRLSPCLAAKCEPFRVWEVVLGLNRGWATWLPAILLLLYNAIRVYLTWKVGPLRDQEASTQFSPHLSDYRHLSWLHVAFSILLLVALSSAAISAFNYLSLPVLLPSHGE